MTKLKLTKDDEGHTVGIVIELHGREFWAWVTVWPKRTDCGTIVDYETEVGNIEGPTHIELDDYDFRAMRDMAVDQWERENHEG